MESLNQALRGVLRVFPSAMVFRIGDKRLNLRGAAHVALVLSKAAHLPIPRGDILVCLLLVAMKRRGQEFLENGARSSKQGVDSITAGAHQGRNHH